MRSLTGRKDPGILGSKFASCRKNSLSLPEIIIPGRSMFSPGETGGRTRMVSACLFSILHHYNSIRTPWRTPTGRYVYARAVCHVICRFGLPIVTRPGQ